MSNRDIATVEETMKTAKKFQKQTKCLISNFALDLVINTDQTSCQYQTTYNRSLDFQGVKTVFVKKHNIFKITHSYTAQSPSVLKKHCACKNALFIKCSWCEQTMCFTCFYDKYHPNNCNSLSQCVDSEN